MSSPTSSSPTSEATDTKEDHLNNRIIRYFNMPPSITNHPSSPMLTNHRKSKTYALTATDSNFHELLPASEARKFTNKDTVMYLEPGTDSSALGHEVWRAWYPFRRRDQWRESNALECFFASPVRTSTPVTSLTQKIQTHQTLMSRVQDLQDDIEADYMPDTIPGWSKGKFRVGEGCRSCFLIIGRRWAEEGVRIVCQGIMLIKIGDDGDVGWRNVDLDKSGEEQGVAKEITVKEKGWKWKTMSLDEAVRAAIRIGGEKGRFEEKSVSEYSKEYYGGKNWRENFTTESG